MNNQPILLKTAADIEIYDDLASIFENSDSFERDVYSSFTVNQIDGLNFPENPDYQVITWSPFKISSAVHLRTLLYIFSSGQWTCSTRVKNTSVNFEGIVGISVRFRERKNGGLIPIGNSGDQWGNYDGYHKVWERKIGESEERSYVRSGKSEYLKDNFENIRQGGLGQIKMVWMGAS